MNRIVWPQTTLQSLTVASQRSVVFFVTFWAVGGGDCRCCSLTLAYSVWQKMYVCFVSLNSPSGREFSGILATTILTCFRRPLQLTAGLAVTKITRTLVWSPQLSAILSNIPTVTEKCTICIGYIKEHAAFVLHKFPHLSFTRVR